eukprot:TRINITY_DN38637_c0_g1_i1.p1 TRINITY_DN38637_c0_g1~~TRINITY_DN38637_c0_g1_i1.p1  ORF type:complete len:656 (+),score=90.10 TRINITY_DN38637_c0_g1_i1:100-2067(+)
MSYPSATPRSLHASRSATSIGAIYGHASGAGTATALLRAESRAAAAAAACGRAPSGISSSSAGATTIRPSTATCKGAALRRVFSAGSIGCDGQAAAASSGVSRRPESAGRSRPTAFRGAVQAQAQASAGTPAVAGAWRRPLCLSSFTERSRSEEVLPDRDHSNESFYGVASTAGTSPLPVSVHGHGDSQTSMLVEDELEEARFMAPLQTSRSKRGSSSAESATERARLRTQTIDLKSDLNESQADARRFRQRMVHLEGDLHGKVQWMLQWERQVATREVPAAEAGPAGVSWTAWRMFVDRGMIESQKTLRLLPRSADLELHRATYEELQCEADTVAASLRDAEEQLCGMLDDNVRLAGLLRRRELKAQERSRGRSVSDVLRHELAAQEREYKQVRAEQEQHARKRALVTTELEEARCQLSTMPAQQMKRRIQRATAQKDEIVEEARFWAEAASLRYEEGVALQREESEHLRSQIAIAGGTLQFAEGRAEEAHKELCEAESLVRGVEMAEERRRRRIIDLARVAHVDADVLRRRERQRRLASIVVQRVWRGRQGRVRAKLIRWHQQKRCAAVQLQRYCRAWSAAQFLWELAAIYAARRERSAIVIQSFHRGQAARRLLEVSRGFDRDIEQWIAAVQIQCAYRGSRVRRKAVGMPSR